MKPNKEDVIILARSRWKDLRDDLDYYGIARQFNKEYFNYYLEEQIIPDYTDNRHYHDLMHACNECSFLRL